VVEGAAEADAGREREERVADVLVVGAGGQLGRLHVREARVAPQPLHARARAPLIRAVAVGGARAGRVDGRGRRPVGVEQRHPAAEVPHDSGDHAARRRDPVHLARGRGRIVERLHDELAEHGVEGAVVERKRLGRAVANVGARHPEPAGVRVLLGRVDGRDALGADDLCHRARQAAGTAADVEHAHPGPDGREGRERPGQLGPVAAGVPVVGLGAAGGHTGISLTLALAATRMAAAVSISAWVVS
jgi:hypothetical protein